MVRLKGATIGLRLGQKTNFNSAMVRLKVLKRFFHAVKMLFQFRYGSIKSKFWPHAYKLLHTFQFRYGSIKRSGSCHHTDTTSTFQFRYGSIKRLSKVGNID